MATQNGKVIAANVIGNTYRNDALKLNVYPICKFLTRNIFLFYVMLYSLYFYTLLFFRENINRSISAGIHKYSEEKKVQEKKYKLLNISFRKPVAKGILHHITLLINFFWKHVKYLANFLFFFLLSSRISRIIS